MNIRRRRLHGWTVRSRPHIERFNRALDVIATATPKTHLASVGDQLLAAVAELGGYLEADPAPGKELRAAYGTLLSTIAAMAAVFVTFERLGRHERAEAIELVRGLHDQADHFVAVVGPLP
jgi:cell division protein ZapA (FtsZ GTPase activity inhibitor)